MKILIGCEESQIVTMEFRKLGFEAYSCDIKKTSGKYAEFHFQNDLFEVVEKLKPNVLIAFPPCTNLAISGTRHFQKKIENGEQQKSIEFFMKIANLNIEHIAIENPIGIMSSKYRKPTQIIQPYYFGDEFQKTTCLWLKNLPLLIHNKTPNLFNEKITHTNKGEFYYFHDKKSGKMKRQPLWYVKARNNHSEIRSKTFPGIAKAMAEQWGHFLAQKYYK